ncbi:unnamed protein product [Thlaspi arvense]|nr:unnamed protein product [Thlaspi arvense]CAH2033824.1 unnamed protein product [Thlaspi arvense]
MLDAKHRAKLSDFGISRVMAVDDTHLTTVVKGTAGYVDPEYYQSEQYTEKSDVYSYGVVLAELITGEKPVSSQRPQNTRTLATYFLVAMRDDRLFDIIDPRIRDGCMLEQVKVMAKIARLCLNLTGERRPSMRDILVELECIRSSPHGVSLHLGCIVENDEEDDQAVEVISRRETFNIDIASTSAYQYDYGAAMSTDVEPLCPSQTW